MQLHVTGPATVEAVRVMRSWSVPLGLVSWKSDELRMLESMESTASWPALVVSFIAVTVFEFFITLMSIALAIAKTRTRSMQ